MTIDKTQLIFGAVILGSILLVAASVRYLLRRSGYLQRVSPNVPIVMISIGALIFAVLAVIGVFEGEQDSGSAVFAALSAVAWDSWSLVAFRVAGAASRIRQPLPRAPQPAPLTAARAA